MPELIVKCVQCDKHGEIYHGYCEDCAMSYCTKELGQEFIELIGYEREFYVNNICHGNYDNVSFELTEACKMYFESKYHEQPEEYLGMLKEFIQLSDKVEIFAYYLARHMKVSKSGEKSFSIGA